MVLPGRLQHAGGGSSAVVLRAALPRGWGSPGFERKWVWPKRINCSKGGAGGGASGVGGPSAESCGAEAWASFERSCRLHLGVRTFADAARMEWTEFLGAGGKDFAMGMALQGVDGWPRLLAAGCCALPVSDAAEATVRYVPLPVEVRERLVEDDPAAQPSECEEKHLSAAACARLGALASLAAMHAHWALPSPPGSSCSGHAPQVGLAGGGELKPHATSHGRRRRTECREQALCRRYAAARRVNAARARRSLPLSWLEPSHLACVLSGCPPGSGEEDLRTVCPPACSPP